MVFTSESLRSFLRRKQIATLEELKQALGTTSTMSWFRKLQTLTYRTSYSHRGKYYTLAEIPQFDEQGLWSSRGVWFSRDGTLLATAQRFVQQSPAGFTASELQALLSVEVKQTLLQLYQHHRVDRRVVADVYVYFSPEAERKREQRLRREARPAAQEIEEPAVEAKLSPELKAAIILFYSLLDERQRRLYAGLEAHKVGYGGDRKIAEFLGLDVHTVARGRRELLGGEVQRQRVRQAGGGRKAVEKKARSDQGHCPSAAPRNRRGSHAGSEMVPPRHPKNRAPTASPEDSGQRKYRTSLIETHGIQLAGESQAAGIGKQQSAAATG